VNLKVRDASPRDPQEIIETVLTKKRGPTYEYYTQGFFLVDSMYYHEPTYHDHEHVAI
jgi:hypothetical protein